MRKNETGHFPYTILRKKPSTWIKDFNVRLKTIKPLDKNIKENNICHWSWQ